MAVLKYLLNRRFLLVASALAASCIGANMMALALFLLVRPFSRSLYRRLVSQYVACMWIDALALLLPGANIQITADSVMPDGITAGIVVANHQYEGDWWYMLMVARFLGLHGNVKIIVRDSLRHVPLLGWLLQLVEYPFIASSWSQSRTPLLHLLRSFTCDGLPVLLFQFPEGDRIDAHVRQQSLSFAQKERRPQLLHVLLPRTTGFNACIEGLRTSHPYVYDMTIAFPGYSGQAPSAVGGGLLDSFLRFCNGEGPKEVHIRLKRYQLEEVLADPHWLDNRWAEKDRVLTYFGRTEQFPAQASNGTGAHGVGRGPRAPGHPVPVGAAGSAPYLRRFNTKAFRAETSALALVRLCLTPLTLPVLALLACPLVSMYLVVTTLRRWVGADPISPGGPLNMIPRVSSRGEKEGLGDGAQTVTPLPIPTPFLPQTPFTSPLISAFDLGVAGAGAAAAASSRGQSPTDSMGGSGGLGGLGGGGKGRGGGAAAGSGGGVGGGVVGGLQPRVRSFDLPSPAPMEEEEEGEESSGGGSSEEGRERGEGGPVFGVGMGAVGASFSSSLSSSSWAPPLPHQEQQGQEPPEQQGGGTEEEEEEEEEAAFSSPSPSTTTEGEGGLPLPPSPHHTMGGKRPVAVPVGEEEEQDEGNATAVPAVGEGAVEQRGAPPPVPVLGVMEKKVQ